MGDNIFLSVNVKLDSKPDNSSKKLEYSMSLVQDILASLSTIQSSFSVEGSVNPMNSETYDPNISGLPPV